MLTRTFVWSMSWLVPFCCCCFIEFVTCARLSLLLQPHPWSLGTRVSCTATWRVFSLHRYSKCTADKPILLRELQFTSSVLWLLPLGQSVYLSKRSCLLAFITFGLLPLSFAFPFHPSRRSKTICASGEKNSPDLWPTIRIVHSETAHLVCWIPLRRLWMWNLCVLSFELIFLWRA